MMLQDDATGGDCALIGLWDVSTKTCTLTTDLSETIQIDSNGITFDGNNHTLTGYGTGNGIYIYSKSGVVIKNLSVSKFYNGIYLYKSNSNALLANNVTNNSYGIWLHFCDNNTLTNNKTALSRVAGISIVSPGANILIGNEALNSSIGIHLRNLASNNMVINNKVANNRYGILLTSASGNTLKDNSTLSNSYGILFQDSRNNTFTDGHIAGNSYGIYLNYFSDANTLKGNNVFDNNYGIYLYYYCSNNLIYNNNFVNNAYQVDGLAFGVNNLFNLEAPIGGNYWSNWTAPDNNWDGFVDNPYIFKSGKDNLPWAKQDGWRPSDSIAPTTTVTLSGAGGNNNWYTSDVQVSLTATDLEGSGVAKTEFSFNSVDWVTYTIPFTVGNEGTTVIYYRSTDYAGNIETVKTQAISMDKTPPIITVTSPIASQYGHFQVVDLKFMTNDDVSGIDKNTVYLDAQPFEPTAAIDLLYLSLGTHTLKVESINNAGLTATASVAFKIIVNGSSMASLILRLYEMGAIDNSGIMNSLIQKIEASQAKIDLNQPEAAINILNAFIQMLDAQSGDHISAFAANLLKADVQYLIGQL